MDFFGIRKSNRNGGGTNVTSNGGRHDGYHNHGYTTPSTHMGGEPHVHNTAGSSLTINQWGYQSGDVMPHIGSEHNHSSAGTPSLFPEYGGPNIHHGRHHHQYAESANTTQPMWQNAGITGISEKYDPQTGSTGEKSYPIHEHQIDVGGEFGSWWDGSVPQPHMGEHDHTGFQSHGRHGHNVNNTPGHSTTHTHHLGYEGVGLGHGYGPHPGESMYPGGRDGSHSHRRRVRPGRRPRPQVYRSGGKVSKKVDRTSVINLIKTKSNCLTQPPEDFITQEAIQSIVTIINSTPNIIGIKKIAKESFHSSTDLCGAAEIFESRLVSGGFGSLVSTLGSRGFDAVEGWPSWCWKPAKGGALNYCMLTIALLVVILL